MFRRGKGTITNMEHRQVVGWIDVNHIRTVPLSSCILQMNGVSIFYDVIIGDHIPIGRDGEPCGTEMTGRPGSILLLTADRADDGILKIGRASCMERV